MKNEEIFKTLEEHKALIVVALVLAIAFTGFYIRIQSVPNFQDKYLMALDPYPFYRYAQDIVEQGFVRELDTMRYYPIGYVPMQELIYHSYFSSVLHTFLKSFDWSLMRTFIWYPAIAAFLALIAFYFLVK